MQPDRFTVKSQEAIQTAQRLAAASKTEITPAHLLVALLEQEEGAGAADLPSIKSRARSAMSDLPVLGEGSAPIRDPPPPCPTCCAAPKARWPRWATGTFQPSMLLAIGDAKSPLADLLPDRASLAKAISEVRGPHTRSIPRTPRIRSRRWRSSAATLTADAASGKLDPVIGRDEEVRQRSRCFHAGPRTTRC